MSDAYVDYTRAFFARWSRFYDLFSGPIAWAYRCAARSAVSEPGARVLDLCTGTGEVALRCAKRGADVTAVDLSDAMMARARAKLAAHPDLAHRLRFEAMDARRLAFADRSFDVTVLSLALHDMPRPVRLEVLREARRVTVRRLVILDYELPRADPWRRALLASIAVFETAYFPRFVAEGLEPLLLEAGLRNSSRTRLGPTFALYTIDC